MKRKLRIAGMVLGILLAVCLAIVLLNSKSVQLSYQDRVYIQRFLNEWHIHESPDQVHKNFQTELNFISIIQDRVQANITGEQIPHAYFGNVCYYFKNRQGIFYDRAVLIEKILLLYHFHFRHAYLYFGNQRNRIKAIFLKSILPPTPGWR